LIVIFQAIVDIEISVFNTLLAFMAKIFKMAEMHSKKASKFLPKSDNFLSAYKTDIPV
jgi:hypothetical protein